VYLDIPAGWINNAPVLAAANAVGGSLCPDIRKFDITRATEILIKGGTEYRNHPLRQLLLAALSNYRPGDAVVKINFGSGLREVDGIQMATIIDRLPGSPYTPSDVAYCRRYLPQYSEAFGEFDVTTEWIYRDRRSFRKLAEDLMATRLDSN